MQPGARLGRYILQKKLGSGSHGQVWSAYVAESPGEHFALKLAETENFMAVPRLKHEAQLLKSLNDHPHDSIVRFRDFFYLAETPSTLVLVEGLVRGKTLDEERFSLSAEQCGLVLRALASALAHIHNLNVVHRDLKLNNILIEDNFHKAPKSSSVKLIDFGIAFYPERTRITDVGKPIGAIRYLAPEVWVGLSDWPAQLLGTNPDGPTRDIFAFGVIGWMILAKQHPAGTEAAEHNEKLRSCLLGKALDGHFDDWPTGDVPPEWKEVLRRCLSLDPKHRPVNGQELEQMLPPYVEFISAAPTNSETTQPKQPGTLSSMSSAPSSVRGLVVSGLGPEHSPPHHLLASTSSWGAFNPIKNAKITDAEEGSFGKTSQPYSDKSRSPVSTPLHLRRTKLGNPIISALLLGVFCVLGVLGAAYTKNDFIHWFGTLSSGSKQPFYWSSIGSKPSPVSSGFSAMPISSKLTRISTKQVWPPNFCGAGLCSASGRRCKDQLLPVERWSIYPLAGTQMGRNWKEQWLDGEVCIRKKRDLEEVCWSVSNLPLNQGKWLVVNTDDLTKYGLELRLFSATKQRNWYGRNLPNGIRSAVLCEGLSFPLTWSENVLKEDVATLAIEEYR